MSGAIKLNRYMSVSVDIREDAVKDIRISNNYFYFGKGEFRFGEWHYGECLHFKSG